MIVYFCVQPVEVEFPSAGPVLRLQQSLSVDLGGVRLRQGELHHVGERSLLQLVAVQRQKLLELTAHFAVLRGEKISTHMHVKDRKGLSLDPHTLHHLGKKKLYNHLKKSKNHP